MRRVQPLGLMVQPLGLRVHILSYGLGLSPQDSGLRPQASGSSSQGLGYTSPLGAGHSPRQSACSYQDSGYSPQGSEYNLQDSGCRSQGSGYRPQDSGYRHQVSGYIPQVYGYNMSNPSGFRVTAFRVQASMFSPLGLRAQPSQLMPSARTPCTCWLAGGCLCWPPRAQGSALTADTSARTACTCLSWPPSMVVDQRPWIEIHPASPACAALMHGAMSYHPCSLACTECDPELTQDPSPCMHARAHARMREPMHAGESSQTPAYGQG